MSNVRIVNKYPNRRLYDTATCQYITLDVIGKFVKDNIPFQVVDKRDGDRDITRDVVLRLVFEKARQPGSPYTLDVAKRLYRGDATLINGRVTETHTRPTSNARTASKLVSHE